MEGAMSVWWLDQRPGCDVQDRQAMLDYLRNFNLAPRPVPDLASLDLPLMSRTGQGGVLLLFAFDVDQPELHYSLRLARRHGMPAIVLLPAVSATERADLIERGADDCMSQPIEKRELAARIHALRRRHLIQSQQVPARPQPADETSTLGDDSRQPALIQTVRGKGYLFTAAPAGR